MKTHKEHINLSVTNNLSFRTPISLLGGLSDTFSYNVNATTQYWWDVGYPFFDVSLYPTIQLEYRLVGASVYSIAYISTNLSYNGLIEGLNNANLGTFWYQYPTFNPFIGYQIYTVNDVYEFGNFSF